MAKKCNPIEVLRGEQGLKGDTGDIGPEGPQGPPGDTGWGLTGNAGTDPSVNFIGTTDLVTFNFRVNNEKSGSIDYVDGRTFFGYLSGNADTRTSADNTGFGWGTLTLNVSGAGNSAFGVKTLTKSTSSYNTALGAGALEELTTGAENTSTGAYSMTAMVNGSGNVANGRYALANATSGDYNVAMGWRPMYRTSNTTESTAVGGYGVLFSNTTGTKNTALGSQAGFNNDGSNNLFLGNKAGFSLTAASDMFVVGNETNNYLITGDFSHGNIGIGTGSTLPNAVTMLDVASTTKGVRLCPMTTTERNAITPISGLLVYDLTLEAYHSWNGSAWIAL